MRKNNIHNLSLRVKEVFYNGGLNCAEATMQLLINDGFVEDSDTLHKMMTGFGGGLQRGLVCGAVVAAVAAISANKGRKTASESRELSATAVAEFLNSFETEFGAIDCQALTKDYESKSDEMYQNCSKIVAHAIELTENMLTASKAKTPI